jgi:hypothetical protein
MGVPALERFGVGVGAHAVGGNWLCVRANHSYHKPLPVQLLRIIIMRNSTVHTLLRHGSVSTACHCQAGTGQAAGQEKLFTETWHCCTLQLF